MGAIKDLFSSERGFFALAIIIAATVLASLHTMTIDQWQSMVTGVFGIYVGGKTVTSTVAMLKGQAVPATPVAPPVAPVVAAATVEVKS